VSDAPTTRPEPPGPAPAASGAPAEDWSERVALSFTIGVYVAVNALADAYLVVDAPDCAHLKTQYVQGNHDWFSTLTSVSGVHRVANTDLHPWKMVVARDDQVQGLVKQLAAHPAAGAVLVTSMPMATITGVDYDRLTRPVALETHKVVASVPGNGLAGDWLDGYADSLKALARNVPLDGAAPQPGNVAVVGYLMDRNEGDHRANLRELERLLGALGLRVVSVWLSGQPGADLAKVRDAAAIISMPYGRGAAKVLGQRLQVPVIETGLPFGLGGTERWLRQIGEALGCGDRTAEVLDRELQATVPLLEWVVPHYLAQRAMVYVGDPHLGIALDELAEELGLRVERHFILGRRVHARALLARCGEARLVIDPKRTHLDRSVRELIEDGRCHVLVTNSMGFQSGPSRAAQVELGFPSFFTHALDERPTYFFRGTLSLVERMVNEMRRAELVVSPLEER
jgi:nitrogenase molybdenum-iron protein alpha/beta subunit